MGPQLKTALYHPRGRKKKLKLAFPVGSELKLQKGVSYLLSITMEAGKLAFLVGSKQNSREGVVQGKKKKKKFYISTNFWAIRDSLEGAVPRPQSIVLLV